MSRKFYLYAAALCTLLLAACSETKEEDKYANWQARSEAFIDSLATVYSSTANQALADSDPQKLHAYKDAETGRQIYVKKLSTSDAEQRVQPLYTSQVSVYYRMSYINGEVVEQNYAGTLPGAFDVPSTFLLSSLISGWKYTLIHMAEGELWTLYIPYQSGYGADTSSSKRQPYSTLIYDVQLEKIVER